MRLETSHRSPWILNPASDTFFMFGGILAASIIFLINLIVPFDRSTLVTMVVFVVFALQGGHTMAPFLLLLASRGERRRAIKLDPKLVSRLSLLMAAPIILYGIAATIYSLRPGPLSLVNAQWPIAVMGMIWFFWNSWHFGMQHFGVLQIYRTNLGLATPSARRFDFRLAIAVGCTLPMFVSMNSSYGADFLSVFFGPRPNFDGPLAILASAIAVTAIATFAWLARTKSLRAPLALAYFSLFAQVLLVWHMPRFFIFMAWCSNHWLQEIFLVSRLYSKTDEIQKSTLTPTRLFFIALVTLGLVSYVYMWVFGLQFMKTYNFSFSGMFRASSELTPGLFLAACAAFALAMFFASGHFYLDRILHKGRRW